MIDLSIGELKKEFKYLNSFFLKKNIKSSFKYPSALGSKKFEKSIKKWISIRNKLDIKSKKIKIIPSLGNREGIFSILFYLFKNNKKKNIVISPDPLYKNYDSAKFFKGKTFFLNSKNRKTFMNDFNKINKDTFKKTIAILVCSPSNPSGYILKKSDLIKIYKKALKYKFYIISDECYSEFYIKNKPVSYVSLINNKNIDKIFVINSLSKCSGVPGLRSGFIISNKKNISNLEKIKIYNGSILNIFNQEISIKLWNDFKRINKIRHSYIKKIDSCYKIISKSIKFKKPEGGIYFWFNIKETGLDSKEFCKIILKNGVRLISSFEISKKEKFYVRMALVENKKKCIKASKIILKIFDELKRKNNKFR
ncbi:aminotransferase class I/II-fold pyridoxal phosphate-dependent enzyme [Candidatus Vidania fulgoroideorum]